MSLTLADFAAEALDWPRVRALFERQALSSLGRRALVELQPRDEAGARAAAERASEVLRASSLPPLAGITDPLPLLAAARQFSRAFDEEEFRVLAVFLRALGKLRRWFSARADELPMNARSCAACPELLGLSEALDQSLDDRGRVLDEATPRLFELRRDIQRLEGEIERVVRRIASSASLRTALEESSKGRVHRRGARPCLAVRARERRKLRGIVHDRSQSGETMFIEPEEVIESGNRLAALVSDERREVGRILTELTRLVLDSSRDLEVAIALAAELELGMISAAYCREMGARLVGDDGGPGMQLNAARHPLLAEKERTGELEACVPIDLRLGDDFDLIVITGPNTGGKTLALKTAGLAALCVRLGLPVICAAGTRIPLFERVYCDIGDEQEVEQSLSTFSSHLARLRTALGDGCVNPGAGPHTLVLIDELGGGTDPDEGAALGEALLEELVRRGAPALVSTHLGRLKEVAYRLPRAENASCEFDLETLAPRYRLQIGTPGESRALAIARRLGLPGDLIERASALLAARDKGSSSQRDSLFRELSIARRDIEFLRAETEARLREVEAQRLALDAACAGQEAEQKLLVREAQASLEARLREVKAQLAAARGLLPRLAKAQAEELGLRLDALDGIFTGATLDDTRRSFLASLKKGDHVWVPRYRRKCQITRIWKEKERVAVRFGRQDLEIGYAEISTFDTL